MASAMPAAPKEVGLAMAPCKPFPSTAASVNPRSLTGIQAFLRLWGRDSLPRSGYKPNVTAQTITIRTPMSVPIYDVLNRKRRGETLSASDLNLLVDGFTHNSIPEYQLSAFLMAVAIRGLDPGELSELTRLMTDSGERWDLRERFDFIADKHSTGGVGDKVSLVLAPWVAACGVKIGMLSGRGLGHTGGTLDKLESIPGFNARLTRDEFERCIHDVGCAITTSTEGIAPADRTMYALRDVTGTVESIPLITASIMSKKLAMGPSALILDVKMGNGAFCRDIETARALSRSLMAAARGSGTRAEVLITDMNRPLGVAAGNSNEVEEAFAALRGKGPADLMEVTRAQAVRILVMSGKYDQTTAGSTLDDVLKSGKALSRARQWVTAQGADDRFIDDPGMLPQPAAVTEVRASRSGSIRSIDTYGAGMLAVELGAGRLKHDDRLDLAAGIMFDRNEGDQVRAGDVIARIRTGARTSTDDLEDRYLALVDIGEQPSRKRPLIFELLTDE